MLSFLWQCFSLEIRFASVHSNIIRIAIWRNHLPSCFVRSCNDWGPTVFSSSPSIFLRKRSHCSNKLLTFAMRLSENDRIQESSRQLIVFPAMLFHYRNRAEHGQILSHNCRRINVTKLNFSPRSSNKCRIEDHSILIKGTTAVAPLGGDHHIKALIMFLNCSILTAS